MVKAYKSEAYAALHEMMHGLYEMGSIDKTTMRQFDRACLLPELALRTARIKGICGKKKIFRAF
ncbi:hypothetical protein [Asticcacaulis excentricus]|uniref:Transcriptional regulator, XRE family n=1 Tax=Asticcacaulis excentricus (strain ATCC 15261 / DSM 4724 / KCTC 12464 / NCIMB 9791 / VKM B-1370 / CB 48) TaxID=573065 RepID=E8RNE5_ASTEC|nr:hypothetical protein [Asticcacaulis excentricus]ADU11776.1 transcriptional regulator, XRE family [Asticcacaulis excentricus CB 48]